MGKITDEQVEAALVAYREDMGIPVIISTTEKRAMLAALSAASALTAGERDEARADALQVGDQMLAHKFRADNAEARLAEALEALELTERRFNAISHHIDEHSFSFAKGFCSQGAFDARRVRDGGQADV